MYFARSIKEQELERKFCGNIGEIDLFKWKLNKAETIDRKRRNCKFVIKRKTVRLGLVRL